MLAVGGHGGIIAQRRDFHDLPAGQPNFPVPSEETCAARNSWSGLSVQQGIQLQLNAVHDGL